MKRLFRSRLPAPLTGEEIENLSQASNLPSEDIEEWHERFNHCYPRGYLSLEEFMQYLQQINHPKNREKSGSTKTLVKKLFRLIDLNDDKHMNFDEFFLFNILMNQGSPDDKLRLIFRLYDQQKDKYLTEEQLEDVLTKMFDILAIPKPRDGLSQPIDQILSRTHITRQHNKIPWNTFRSYVLQDQSLFHLLLPSTQVDQSIRREAPSIITTRF